MSARRMIMNDKTFALAWANPAITTEAIARFNGVTRAAVSYRARVLGLPSRADCRRVIGRDKELLAELWNRGVSTVEIAAHLGYASHSCISAITRKMGLPRRARGGHSARRNGGWPANTPIKAALAAIAEERLLDGMRASAAASDQAMARCALRDGVRSGGRS